MPTTKAFCMGHHRWTQLTVHSCNWSTHHHHKRVVLSYRYRAQFSHLTSYRLFAVSQLCSIQFFPLKRTLTHGFEFTNSGIASFPLLAPQENLKVYPLLLSACHSHKLHEYKNGDKLCMHSKHSLSDQIQRRHNFYYEV